jgi:hypothetical protein
VPIIGAGYSRKTKAVIMKVIQFTVLATVLVCSQPAYAAFAETWVSHTGSNISGCGPVTSPCQTLLVAVSNTTPGGQVNVLDAGDFGGVAIEQSVTIVNATSGTASSVTGNGSTVGSSPQGNFFILAGAAGVVTLRGFVLSGIDNPNSGVGVLILNASQVNIEDCLIMNQPGGGIEVYANGEGFQTLAASINVKIKNSTITGNGAGIKIAPTTATPINVVIEGTAIDNNTGGGLKADGTSGGPIAVSISDSSISLNPGNGVNAVGTSYNVVINLNNDVIASNGTSGIQANGGSAAVLVNNTSVLNNTVGATSSVNGGRILTYGNNRTVGSPGSGFTGTAPLN